MVDQLSSYSTIAFESLIRFLNDLKSNSQVYDPTLEPNSELHNPPQYITASMDV